MLLSVVLLVGCGQQQTRQGQPPSSQSVNTISPVQKSDDVTSWQTYRSPDYGFEIKHPKEWIEKASMASIKSILLDLSTDTAHSIAVTYHEKITDIKPTYTSLAEYSANFEKATAIKFKGDDGFTAILTSKIGSQNIVQKFIVVQHNNHIYVINYVDDHQYTAIKKQISDTLTFTK